MTKPIAIYTRVSTSEQAISGLGLEAQASACSSYADLTLNGHRRQLFTEQASAASIRSRPVLATILDNASSFSALIVKRLDRLARNTRELLDILARLSLAGCRLHSVTEHLDTDSPAGKVMTTIIAAFAEYERDLIASRTRDAMAIAKSHGKHCGRPPFGFNARPFGPVKADCRLALDCQAMHRRGLSSYQIARVTGLPHSTVRYVIRNPIYGSL